MFIGHYGPAFALKSADKKTPLWIYLMAVQLVDVFFFSFVLVGIEKMNIVPGYTAYNSYDLYCMPYTHSLLANVFWFLGTSALVFLYIKWKKIEISRPSFVALLIGFAVFTHFLTDLIVHTPDLPLWNNDSPKLGFGLWNYVGITMGVELLLLLGGAFLYFKKTGLKASGLFNKKFVGILLFMMLLTVITPLLPEPETTNQLASQGLLSFFVIGGLGYWLERK